ncbi:YcgN family cysteine cluster protein [Hyphomonadaceae bacterium ML37]|nr:YcgN family cysteine cluster protein [Hyphomonadaceae bacterium ML37]
MAPNDPFYETKTLAQMTQAEWESLCDGCGRCCTLLLEDDDGSVWRTSLACRLLDLKTVRCRDYANRHAKVPGCVKLTPDRIGQLGWMPDTCAYRLIDEGKPLPDWHPLRTGDPASVIAAGISVKGALISEALVDEDEQEDYITNQVL